MWISRLSNLANFNSAYDIVILFHIIHCVGRIATRLLGSGLIDLRFFCLRFLFCFPDLLFRLIGSL